MSLCSGYSRFYRLVHDSISPYTEQEVDCLTKEAEKELLVSLSQVFRQIQLWTCELKVASDEEPETLPEHHDDISKIVADLVFFLTIKSQYVQHLVGNILVSISKFLAISGSNWDDFIRSLCICFELALIDVLPFPIEPSEAGFPNLSFDSSSSTSSLKPRLKNAGWSCLAGIVGVLRNILKCLMQEDDYDDDRADVLLDLVTSCLSNVSRVSMDAIDLRAVDQEPRIVFMGNLIQLLCSLVEQINSVDDASCSLDNKQQLLPVTNLVPKLLHWCLGQKGECVKTCIYQYFSHKLLVLMIRLSSQTRPDCCILVSWLHLLHNYFGELLQHLITTPGYFQDDSLEGSPFLLSVSDGEIHNVCLPHLQRKVVFLFLRCALLLMNEKDTEKHCSCETESACFTCDSISNSNLLRRNKGLSELYEWLQRHCPMDGTVDYDTCMEKSMKFSLSFLQLYMSEDDLLFKVLLQLFDVPYHGVQKAGKINWTSQGLKEYVPFHLSNVFNPVLLFHLFLSELLYDHQVLLDYLISKDTGISCAEYLLRCLRVICDSWHLFIKFSLAGEVSDLSSQKRRKVIPDSPNFQRNIVQSPSKECHSGLEYGYKLCTTRRSHYKEAKDCLLSLKSSVENLHQKNLFLYNPEVLLKRLSSFQDLCSKHEDHGISE